MLMPCILVIEYFVFECDIRFWKKGPPCKFGGKSESSLSEPSGSLHSIQFLSYLLSKSIRNAILRLQERLKCVFPPAPAMVAHTKRTFIKSNHSHSQNAGYGKKPTVISTCSFIAEKNKKEFLPLFSESSPALRNPLLHT